MSTIITTSRIRVSDPGEHLTPMIGGFRPTKIGGRPHVGYMWNLNWLANFSQVALLKHVFVVSIIRKTLVHIPPKYSGSIEKNWTFNGPDAISWTSPKQDNFDEHTVHDGEGTTATQAQRIMIVRCTLQQGAMEDRVYLQFLVLNVAIL